MRKFYHFIPYPDIPPMTRQERMREREGTARDIVFMKIYALFFFGFFILVALGSKIIEWSNRDTLPKLHAEICSHVPASPLCSDFELLERVDTIAKKKSVPTRLIIGIWNAESTLGTHFNKGACASYNNWGGMKGRKFEDGRVEWYSQNRKRPDENGCWLYKFTSVEQATESLVNTIALGYKGCDNKTTCIAYDYVGHPDIAEVSWIGRVEKFYEAL